MMFVRVFRLSLLFCYCNEQVYFIIIICVFCNRSHFICMEKNWRY